MLRIVPKFLVKATGFVLSVSLCLPLQASAQSDTSSATSPSPASFRRVLDSYCVTCHNESLNTGNLQLDALDLAHISEGAEIWEKVVHKLRTVEMPPPDQPQPSKRNPVEGPF